jgi:hypothetical protein
MALQATADIFEVVLWLGEWSIAALIDFLQAYTNKTMLAKMGEMVG